MQLQVCSSKEPSVGQPSARALLLRLEALGISLEHISKSFSIPLEYLHSNEGRIPVSLYKSLWQLAIEKSDDSALGLTIANQEAPNDLGLVAHVVFNSETIGDGIRHYIRLFRIINEAITVTFHQNDTICRIRFQHNYPEYYVQADIERTMSIAISRATQALEKPIDLIEVAFQHSEPEYSHLYDDIFNCDIRYDQPYSEVVFDSSVLSYRPVTGSPTLASATLFYANKILSKILPLTFVQKVKKLIETHMSNSDLDAESAASLLNMSRQTLYRKLKNNGHSYSELTTDVKKEKAKSMLLGSQYSLTRIACELGFSEVSAFTRAFKRWTGETPAEYRKQHS